MCRGSWGQKDGPWIAPPMKDTSSGALFTFWGFSALASAVLGCLEISGQRRALTALSALCAQTPCGSLFHVTRWIVGAQIVVCAAVVVYVLSCVRLLSCPVTGYRLAVCLLLALVACSFQLIATIGQFTNAGWVLGPEGGPLDVERGEVIFGLYWCLTIVFVLMVLLVCADHAQHLVANQALSPRYLSQSIMAQIDAHRPKKLRPRTRRESRLSRSWHGAGRELYPILESEREEEEDELVTA